MVKMTTKKLKTAELFHLFESFKYQHKLFEAEFKYEMQQRKNDR
jgi:hypothetical protein